MKPKTFAIVAGAILATLSCNPTTFFLWQMGRITNEQAQSISANTGSLVGSGLFMAVIIWLTLRSQGKELAVEQKVESPRLSRVTIALIVMLFAIAALAPFAMYLRERGSPGAPTASTWVVFVAEDGTFKAHFPTQPKLLTDELEFAPGVFVPRHMFTCPTEDRRGSHFIEFQEFPTALAQQWTDETNLPLRAQNAIVTGLGATIVREEAVQIGSHRGHECLFEHTGQSVQHFVLQRTYFIGNRLYMMSVAKTTSIEDVEYVGTRFVDSFELLSE